MTDDDLLKPGAIGRVLSELGKNYFLIVAGAEVRSSNFAELLVPNRPNFLSDRIYKPSEWDEFAVALIGHLTFVGAVIVKRELWLSRRKEKYFGSGFVHVGVLFDEKISGDIYIASAPLVTIRFGNAQWVNRAFQIWMVNWPNLVWSFSSISDSAKVKICPREPWASLKTLLFNRALGVYSMREYELFISDKPSSSGRKKLSKLIAGLPRWLLYIPAWLYVRLLLPNSKYVLFNLNESWRGRL
jgi:hypothetical protein